MTHLTTCPACASSHLAPAGEKNGCTLSHCLDCKTFFASDYEAETSSALYNDYAPNTMYVSKPASKTRRAKNRLARLKRKFGGSRFLDVGCNVGYAVEAARQVGYQATGIDLNPKAIELAKQMFPQCRFFSGYLDQLIAAGEKFDLIYCAEVIEHVPEPHGFAAQLAALLAPGGAMFMTTPDSGHWRRDRVFANWHEVFPPEHLIWFNRTSLAMVLKKAGFDDVRYRFNLKTGLRAYATKKAA